MKIFKTLCVLLLGLAAATAAYGQNSETVYQSGSDNPTENSPGYVMTDFDEIIFGLPQGMRIERGDHFTAVYPDGTFGISMQKVNFPSTKKIANELCNRLADSMGLPRNLVKKVNYSGAKGAQAQGKIDGKIVTCIVLVYEDHQLQITTLADPTVSDWMNDFIKSIKAKK